MSETQYTYAISSLSNGAVNTDDLVREIRESAITVALDYVSTDLGADLLTVQFKEALSIANKTILDGYNVLPPPAGSVLGDHQGNPAQAAEIKWHSVKDFRSDPPAAVTGDKYIVGSAATGAWQNQEDNLAEYDGGSWIFETPISGVAAFSDADGVLYVFRGGVWEGRIAPHVHTVSASGEVQTTSTGGVAVPDMSFDPSVGEYDVNFSGVVSTTMAGAKVSLYIAVDGVEVPGSLRVITKKEEAFVCQGKAIVADGQSVEGFWKVTKGTVKIGDRLLTLQKVA